MKKIIIIICALFLLVVLTACDAGEKELPAGKNDSINQYDEQNHTQETKEPNKQEIENNENQASQEIEDSNNTESSENSILEQANPIEDFAWKSLDDGTVSISYIGKNERVMFTKSLL